MKLLPDIHALIWFQAGDQTLTERCPVITRDRSFHKYGVEVVW